MEAFYAFWRGRGKGSLCHELNSGRIITLIRKTLTAGQSSVSLDDDWSKIGDATPTFLSPDARVFGTRRDVRGYSVMSQSVIHPLCMWKNLRRLWQSNTPNIFWILVFGLNIRPENFIGYPNNTCVYPNAVNECFMPTRKCIRSFPLPDTAPIKLATNPSAVLLHPENSSSSTELHTWNAGWIPGDVQEEPHCCAQSREESGWDTQQCS